MNPLVKAFVDALTPQARHRLDRDPAMTLLIERCITGGWTPEALAADVGYKVGWQEPKNAHELMTWRLHRAAGDDVDGGSAE